MSQDQDPATAERTMLYVCVTCRGEEGPSAPPEARAGRRLLEALRLGLGSDDTVAIVPVECLSVCKRPCTVSFAAPGKWTYVYGDLAPEDAAPLVLAAARLYGAAPDGLIPWKQRPDALKKGVVARVPPLPQPSAEDQAA